MRGSETHSVAHALQSMEADLDRDLDLEREPDLERECERE